MSQKQIQANKINAQSSTGPKSLKGKRRSSENSIKHGLNLAFDPICDPRFSKLVDRFLKDEYELDYACELASAILLHRRVMDVMPHQYNFKKEVFGRAEIAMIREVEGDAELGFVKLTKRDRQTIASFLRRFNRVNERLGSEVEQRVKRLAPLARYQQKTVSQLAKLIRKK